MRNMDHIILHYYVLPLIGITFKDMISDNYVRTWITRDCTTVIIEFKMIEHDTYSREFISSWIMEGTFYQVYSVPEKFIKDMKLIVKGKYSKISNEAKETVKKLSGLPFNKMINGKRVTSSPLLALTKAPELKEYQESKLNVPIDKDAFGRTIQKVKIPDELDLFDAPTEGIFIEYEDYEEK